MTKPAPIESLSQAVEYFQTIVRTHPERDSAVAYRAAMTGQRRKYPALYLYHLVDPDDKDTPVDDFKLPEVSMPAGPEADLAREIIALLVPLQMLNPVSSGLQVIRYNMMMAVSFGVPLNPETGYSPAYTLSLKQALTMPPPDPCHSGLMPELRQRIELVKKHIPAGSGIYLTFGIHAPFNLAHGILGDEALLGPTMDPQAFEAFMDRVTTFLIAATKGLLEWIGPKWLSPELLPISLSECSVNLISPDTYVKHVLPHDLRVAAAFDQVAIHPCSGAHVFHATLKHLPNVALTEAAQITKGAARVISIDEALAAIGDRPIALRMGRELRADQDVELIQRDLDRYAQNSRLLFNYTGMHWRIKDRPRIRDFHQRLDAYWQARYGAMA